MDSPPLDELEHAPDAAEPDAAQPPSVRRILVALDASAHSHAALAAATALAMRLHSEIHGIFVEDINLLRLAELPFAREVRFGQPDARQMRAEEVLRGLRARATVLRHELQEMAEQSKVSSTFRVVRGGVTGELLAAAREADLLALGRWGHSVARRARLGSTARAAITRAASAVLLVQPDIEAGPVLALYDGSAAAGRALSLAAHLAGDSEVRVLVWGPDEQTAYDRRQLAIHLLEEAGAAVQFQHLAGGDAPRLLTWVNKQHGSLLILPAGEGDWPEAMVDILLDEAQQHLLLIR